MNLYDVSSYLTLVVIVPFLIVPFPFYLLDKLTPLLKSVIHQLTYLSQSLPSSKLYGKVHYYYPV